MKKTQSEHYFVDRVGYKQVTRAGRCESEGAFTSSISLSGILPSLSI